MMKIEKTKAILLYPVKKITPDIVNFMITHGRGLLCVPLPRSRCEELQLYPMSEDNTSLLGHAVHHVRRSRRGYGCTTGVSAYDRSATIRALVTGNIKPSELARPGHIFFPFTDMRTEY